MPYTNASSVSSTVKVRLIAGLSVGTYRSSLNVRVSGLSYGYLLGALVTQTANQPVISITNSLTGSNGFKYNIGGGPIIKSVEMFSANLMGAPGSLTLTSSNPAVFQLVGNDNVRRSTFTVNYDTPNPGIRFPLIAMSEGLAIGEYAATVIVTG